MPVRGYAGYLARWFCSVVISSLGNVRGSFLRSFPGSCGDTIPGAVSILYLSGMLLMKKFVRNSIWWKAKLWETCEFSVRRLHVANTYMWQITTNKFAVLYQEWKSSECQSDVLPVLPPLSFLRNEPRVLFVLPKVATRTNLSLKSARILIM